MKVIYVAGPFRAKNDYEKKLNIDRAEAVAAELVLLGYFPICPHLNTAHFEGLMSDKFFLELTLELMRRCDAVVLVPGWEHSEGTLGEIKEAKRLGIPVYTDMEANSAL